MGGLGVRRAGVRAALVALLALAGAVEAEAQAAPRVEAWFERGQRVRLASPRVEGGRTVGLFAGIAGADTLVVLRRPGGELRVPFSALESLEASRIDRPRGALRGAAAGAVGGAALLWLLSSVAPFGEGQERSDKLRLGLVVGAPAGAALGAIVGALVGVERWEAVPLGR